MQLCLAAICSVVAMVLSGCGSEPTPSPVPTPAPAQEPSPIPSISMPHCDDGTALAAPYYVSNTMKTEEPFESSETTLCWDDSGIVIFTNQTERDIWQTCEECECAVYDGGSVAEVMLGPVTSLDKAATWYLEMNVGAVHDAFWGGIINNSKGDDQMYVAAKDCKVD